jgi:beta-galactosidase GanA
LHIFDEVREVSRGLKESADFLRGTSLSPPGMAVHLSTLAWAQFRFQPLAKGFDYLRFMLERIYRPLMDVHLRADVIDPAAALDDYAVVFSPFLPALDESGLRARLLAWIEDGGTWVAGPFTDIRTMDGAKPMHAPFGSLEEWAGVYCRYELPGEPREFTMEWADGRTSPGALWYCGFESKDAATLARYQDGPLSGLAAITETKCGQGRIIVLGTLPPAQDLQQLMVELAGQHDVFPAATATSNVLVAPREGEAGKGAVVIEIENRPGTLSLPGEAYDLLSGETHSGTIEIAPYQVLVLEWAAHRARRPAKTHPPLAVAGE